MGPVVLLALVQEAAAGPVTVGPPGGAPARIDATAVSVAEGTGEVTVAVSVRAAEDAPIALLWPMPGIRPSTAARVDPGAFAHVEAATRPRVDGLGCDDLVDVVHWRSVPGCTSNDYVPPAPARGRDAVDDVGIGGASAEVELGIERIEAAELQAWLDRRGFALDADAAAALAPHVDAGEPILTITTIGGVPAGAWTPPVRFLVDAPADGTLRLPLSAGEPLADGHQALTVLGGAPIDQPNPEIVNYPRGYVADGCLLAPGESAAERLAAARAELEAAATLPVWVLEHAGSAEQCAPCTAEPLDAPTLAELGVIGVPAEVRLWRLALEWTAGALDEDPALHLAGPQGDAGLVFVAHDPALGAYFPRCGEEEPRAGAASCPNLGEPGGCDTTVLTRASAGAAILLGLALLRRRRAAAALAVWLVASSAHAGPLSPQFDVGPKTEISGALAVAGTDRVVPTGLEHGGPWALNPYLGVELRRTVTGWRRGRNVGALASVRGWTGRAAPGAAEGRVGFTVLDPSIGVDLRHGRFLEADPCLFGRYGASFVASASIPGVGPARVVPSGALHAGLGAWLGRGPSRTAVELRLVVIPRTDAWESTFHPNVGLPGWRFFPGTANLWLGIGHARYL